MYSQRLIHKMRSGNFSKAGVGVCAKVTRKWCLKSQAPHPTTPLVQQDVNLTLTCGTPMARSEKIGRKQNEEREWRPVGLCHKRSVASKRYKVER
jgi:hypothetical protein